jgi:hypothetical protein
MSTVLVVGDANPNDDPVHAWHSVAELLPHVDVLLPDESEVTAQARAATGPAAALALAGHGVLVVVKQGSVGAFAATEDGAVPVSALGARRARWGGDSVLDVGIDSAKDDPDAPAGREMPSGGAGAVAGRCPDLGADGAAQGCSTVSRRAISVNAASR